MTRPYDVILAATADGVIGKDGRTPWHYPQDLENFKLVTMERLCICGTKTYHSLPPLPGRRLIVITRDPFAALGYGRAVCVSSGMRSAMLYAQTHGAVPIVIGGAETVRSALEYGPPRGVYLTIVPDRAEGDARVDLEALTRDAVKVIRREITVGPDGTGHLGRWVRTRRKT